MPIGSQSDLVLTAACASISPRMQMVENRPDKRIGSENCQNTWGNSSNPEYQCTSTFWSYGGLRKCKIEKRAEVTTTAGNVLIDCRKRPRIAPRKSDSSIRATTIAVRNIRGNWFQGAGSFKAATSLANRQTPSPKTIAVVTTKPPAR